MTSDMNKECLQYCFSGIIQAHCNAVKDHWNTHYIRRWRHTTVKGRPDSLFFLPEYHGAGINLLSSVEPSEIECVSQQISVQQGSDEYQEYFDYVCEGLSIEAPTTWKEAFQQYEKFTHIAENGFSPSICALIQGK